MAPLLPRDAVRATVPLSVSSWQPTGICLGDTSLLKSWSPGHLTLTRPLAGSTLTLTPATGGGIPGNLARVLPDGVGAVVDPDAWRRPSVFDWLAAQGVAEDELRRVFNVGIGYCAVVPPTDVRHDDIVIGRVEAGVAGVEWSDA